MFDGVMSDSGSSVSGETRMLERRVSNNRADLNGDQQMNYFLAWFNTWSELQRSDFVSVLAGKMTTSGSNGTSNGIESLENAFKSMDCGSSRPPSLFSCQVKLFHDWFAGWSDDQKNYLVLRLKDIDTGFFAKYEDRVQNPKGLVDKDKDYFEPGIPVELINTPTVVEDKENDNAKNGKEEKEEVREEEDVEELKKKNSTSSPLSPISEDL